VLQVSGGQALVHRAPEVLEPLQLPRQIRLNRRQRRPPGTRVRLGVTGLNPRKAEGEADLVWHFAPRRWWKRRH
jgi:hypothetical protein